MSGESTLVHFRHRLSADTSSPVDMASAVSISLAKRPAFARISAWFVLEGRPITEEMGDDPFIRRPITTLSANESEDPPTQSGAVVALLRSDALLVGEVDSAIGREHDDERLPDAHNELIAAALIHHRSRCNDIDPSLRTG